MGAAEAFEGGKKKKDLRVEKWIFVQLWSLGFAAPNQMEAWQHHQHMLTEESCNLSMKYFKN